MDFASPNQGFRIGEIIQGIYSVESNPINGGMGSVWRVKHLNWNIDLAMKRPHDAYFRFANDILREKFVQECERWIGLGLHPNIVSCYYVRDINGIPTIFSEWMDGGSLESQIRSGRLYDGTEEEQQERILDIAIQFARGLNYSHQCGFVHQDVKPDNLLLSLTGDAKVSDFGLASARSTLVSGINKDGLSDADASTILAVSGGYTPAYCSPEQITTGKRVSRKTDIYSWAVSVMEMFVGSRPWTGEKIPGGIAAGLKCQTYFKNARIEIPSEIKALLKECLELEPDKRPTNFSEIEQRLTTAYKAIFGHAYYREKPKAAADTATAINNRALSLLDIGRIQEADELWNKALSIDPCSLDALYNHTLFNWRSGRIDDLQAISTMKNLYTALTLPSERKKCEVLINRLIRERGQDGDLQAESIIVFSKGAVTKNRYLSNKGWIVCFISENKIFVTDKKTRSEIIRLEGTYDKNNRIDPVTCAASDDGRYLAVAFNAHGIRFFGPFGDDQIYNGIVLIYDLKKNHILKRLDYESIGIVDLVFLKDSHELVIAKQKGQITYLSLDGIFSKSKGYDISPMTIDLMRRGRTDHTIIIAGHQEEETKFKHRIIEYQARSGQITAEFVNPDQRRHVQEVLVLEDSQKMYIETTKHLYSVAFSGDEYDIYEEQQADRYGWSYGHICEMENGALLLAANDTVPLRAIDTKKRRTVFTENVPGSVSSLWRDDADKKAFYLLNNDGVFRYTLPPFKEVATYEVSKVTSIKNHGEYAAAYSMAIQNARSAMEEKRYGDALRWNDIARRIPCFENSEETRVLNESLGEYCYPIGIRSITKIVPLNPKSLVWNAEGKTLINSGADLFGVYKTGLSGEKQSLAFVLWNGRTSKIHRLFPSKPDALWEISSDGTFAIALEYSNSCIGLLRMDLVEKTEQRVSIKCDDRPSGFSYNKNGTMVAFITRDKNYFARFDLQAKKLLATQSKEEPKGVYLTDGGEYAFICTENGVQMWDTCAMKLLDNITIPAFADKVPAIERIDEINKQLMVGLRFQEIVSFKGSKLVKLDKESNADTVWESTNMPSARFSFDMPNKDVKIGFVERHRAVVLYDTKNDWLFGCAGCEIEFGTGDTVNKAANVILKSDGTLWYIDYIYSETPNPPQKDSEVSVLLNQIREEVEQRNIRIAEDKRKSKKSRYYIDEAMRLWDEGYTATEYWEENKENWNEDNEGVMKWFRIFCKNNGEPDAAIIKKE